MDSNNADLNLLEESTANVNVCNKKLVLTEKMSKNTAEWSIVHFESDEEEIVEGFSDLVPSSWITARGTLSWFPINEHRGTINKLVKQCTKPKPEWNCFSIKKIEENIGKFTMRLFFLYN